nr:hypothetical protein [Tanacetum cinerariifolium]
MISKDGTISEFPRYTSSKEEEEEEDEEDEEKEESKKKRSKEALGMGSNSECSGYAASNNKVESDLESTARSEPKCKEMEDTCEKMAPSRRGSPSNDENSSIAAIITQQLQNIIPQIVTCSYKTFLACNPRDYDGKGGAIALTRWIEIMELVIENSRYAKNQKNHTMVEANRAGYTDRFHELAKLVPHLSAILTVGILTDEAVHCGTLTRSSEKRKEVEEISKQGGSWKDNKKAKVEKDLWRQPLLEMETRAHILSMLSVLPIIQKASVKQTAPVSAIRMGNNQRVCYECGSTEHLRNTCPKLNRAPGQVGNRLTLEGNRNTQKNGNQAGGRAFSVNAIDALQDPNVVAGTFSLNDHFATVLFDSGANFSFISTKFAPLLNVKPSIVILGYVIEVANGKKEEVDSIIRDCKLGNSLFTIDLIPLGHGSFDVIIGMD